MVLVTMKCCADGGQFVANVLNYFRSDFSDLWLRKLPSDECYWMLPLINKHVQVMAWCRQATSHYLSQCWTRSMSPYGSNRPQWSNLHALVSYLCLRVASWLGTVMTSNLYVFLQFFYIANGDFDRICWQDEVIQIGWRDIAKYSFSRGKNKYDYFVDCSYNYVLNVV